MKKPKLVVDRELEARILATASSYPYDMKERIVRESYGRGSLDFYDEIGGIPEGVLDNEIFNGILRGLAKDHFSLGMMPSASQYQDYFDNVELPEIKQSNKRSVEWMIYRMETERPDIIEDFQARGWNPELTTYDGSYNWKEGSVKFTFRDVGGDTIAVVIYRPTDQNYEVIYA